MLVQFIRHGTNKFTYILVKEKYDQQKDLWWFFLLFFSFLFFFGGIFVVGLVWFFAGGMTIRNSLLVPYKRATLLIISLKMDDSYIRSWKSGEQSENYLFEYGFMDELYTVKQYLSIFNNLKSGCNDTNNNPEHSFCLKPSGFSYTDCFFKNFRKYYISLSTGVLLNSLKYASHSSK